MLAQHGDAVRFERTSGNLRIACRLDAFGEAKPHQQKLIGGFGDGKHVVSNEAMAVFLDAREPAFRPFFGCGRVAVAGDVEPAMGARADPGIFMGAPVDQIVPAFAARASVI